MGGPTASAPGTVAPAPSPPEPAPSASPPQPPTRPDWRHQVVERVRRRRRLLIVLASLVVLYTVFGFLILPWIVRTQLEKRLSAALHRETTIARVRTNPYALSVTIDGLLVKAQDGSPFLSWDRLYVNLAAWRIVRREVSLDEVYLLRFHARVALDRQGRLNFQDLLDENPSAEPQPRCEPDHPHPRGRVPPRALPPPVLGGSFTGALGDYDLKPGFLASASVGYTLLDGEGPRPYLAFTGTVSASIVPTRSRSGPSDRPDLTATDLRAAVVFGKRFFDFWMPYLGAAAFGGPVFFAPGGQSLTGSDVHHYRLTAGSSFSLPAHLEAFVEVGFLGEQAVLGGLGWAF